MSDHRPPYDRRPTRPTPKPIVEAPASASALAAAKVPTLMTCPWCEGQGMVMPQKGERWVEEYAELAERTKEPDDGST